MKKILLRKYLLQRTVRVEKSKYLSAHQEETNINYTKIFVLIHKNKKGNIIHLILINITKYFRKIKLIYF